MTKLHLGCGTKHLDGWINIDIQALPGVDVVSDVRYLPDWLDNSVDIIYACHVLEHLENPIDVLTRWFEILKPTGILRIAVPNFEACAEWYMSNKKISDIHGLIMGGHKNQFDYHCSIFDFESIKETLENIGFHDVQHYDWRDTDHAVYDDYSQAYLPHMNKEAGTLMSLNVEAIK